MKKNLFLICLILSFYLHGCIPDKDGKTEGNVVLDESKIKEISLGDLTSQIGKLPLLDESTIDSPEKYKTLADNLNNLIELLNEQGGFEIDKIDTSTETYRKISRVITEYAPLIDNYNEVVNSARNYDEKNPESEKAFYIAAAKFGLETTLIVTTIFAMPVYRGVGIAYRASGLNRLAFKHPKSIKIVLGHAHWFVRERMVQGSSEIAGPILDRIMKDLEKIEGLKDIRVQIKTEAEKIKVRMGKAKENATPMIQRIKNETKSLRDEAKNFLDSKILPFSQTEI